MKYKSCKNEFWNEKEAKDLFQTLPFYNLLIEKPEIKKLSNVELLHELPFSDEVSKTSLIQKYQRHLKDMPGVTKSK